MITTRYAAYLADTDQSRRIHHHLRYLVYCERKHFEIPTIRAGIAQERDSVDPFSTPFIVHDNQRAKWLASARLIASTRTVLPVQRMGAVDPAVAQELFHAPVAEISRLAMLEGQHGWSEDSRLLLQAATLSLLDYSLRNGIATLIFLVSAALARALRAIGIPMRACGPTIEHRGRRRAFSANVRDAIRAIPWVDDRLGSGRIEPTYRRYSELLRESATRWAPLPAGRAKAAVA